LSCAIRIKLAAREQLRQLTRREQRYVLAALELLCKDDAIAAMDVLQRRHGIGFVKMLQGSERVFWKIRVRHLHIFCTFVGETLVVFKIRGG
jgi:mRNA-degrading endonuclease RelE of RelBE toxin-antitoxin system